MMLTTDAAGALVMVEFRDFCEMLISSITG